MKKFRSYAARLPLIICSYGTGVAKIINQCGKIDRENVSPRINRGFELVFPLIGSLGFGKCFIYYVCGCISIQDSRNERIQDLAFWYGGNAIFRLSCNLNQFFFQNTIYCKFFGGNRFEIMKILLF